MWLRLRQIALVAAKLQPVLDDLRSVFGLEVCHVDPGVGVFGLENSLLPVGNQFIEVVAPVEEKTAGGRYLERRGGDGGYMFITQKDGAAPDGPWWPAGPDWKPAVRTDVVRSIRAAELQSPDPEALAARWSEILELPVARDAEGHPELRLENARARFVSPTDGRPEGLGGLDLEVADRARALRTAKERGLLADDEAIHICGMRFRLVD